MKIAIIGGKQITEPSILTEAIEKSGFTITELFSSSEDGIPILAEKWATIKGIPITRFPVDWNDVKVKGAEVAMNKWNRPYNRRAAAMREEKMLAEADGVILILGETERDYVSKKVKDSGKAFYSHKTEKKNEDYKYFL